MIVRKGSFFLKRTNMFLSCVASCTPALWLFVKNGVEPIFGSVRIWTISVLVVTCEHLLILLWRLRRSFIFPLFCSTPNRISDILTIGRLIEIRARLLLAGEAVLFNHISVVSFPFTSLAKWLPLRPSIGSVYPYPYSVSVGICTVSLLAAQPKHSTYSSYAYHHKRLREDKHRIWYPQYEKCDTKLIYISLRSTDTVGAN